MKQTLYLMRHGQTLFNVRRKVQGWCDAPLTELGIAQGKTAGAYFKAQHIIFDHAYSSTSERACDTLELVTNQPYTRLKGLKEWHFGTFEGESEDLNPPLPYQDFFVKYGGEEEKSFQKRAVETCTTMMEQGHQTVLAVSHGAFCGQFRKFWDETCEAEYKIAKNHGGIGNCCIFKYEVEQQKFKLVEIVNHEAQLAFIEA
ncbi:histidine phosphatase family protein [Isobaculum melis]|uniref:Probable phosphoglycerate mutase n=1 Tax=Isobaculum melis TaxID=142588 RepID=A0A1H9S3L3_9LACT|nr:histidine phosphatase family protein [Isobaculum melis]SER78719.1 probable phosphoglycerate mutase [Isobaculum melis]